MQKAPTLLAPLESHEPFVPDSRRAEFEGRKHGANLAVPFPFPSALLSEKRPRLSARFI